MVVLTRPEVIDVRHLVTVAEITTTIRGLAAEVPFDHDAANLERPCVINCDGLHTVAQEILTERVGSINNQTMAAVCHAVGYALGC